MGEEEFWSFKEENFGLFLEYVKDENVTDINFNGKDVWIDHLQKGRYRAELEITKSFVDQFCKRLSNAVSKNFNQFENLLEAETKTLRISVIHESIACTGTSISIRKTEARRRLNEKLMIRTKYCSREMMMFLENCVKAHMNIVMCGLPGAGKTELLKYLTKYIPDQERVITIEDNLEIHYRELNPQKDCVELKIEERFFDYTKAIKSCLRQNPSWIMLSEARSTEVKYLLEALSTGTHCLTTLHTDDVRKVPDRMQNMMKDSISAQRIENDIYSFVDIGVLVKKSLNEDGILRRYIDQICIYDRDQSKKSNQMVLIADDGEVINKELPRNLKKQFIEEGIKDPFWVRKGYEAWPQ